MARIRGSGSVSKCHGSTTLAKNKRIERLQISERKKLLYSTLSFVLCVKEKFTAPQLNVTSIFCHISSWSVEPFLLNLQVLG
jgi:hypothetical protein